MKWLSFSSKLDFEPKPKGRNLKRFGVELKSIINNKDLWQSVGKP